MDTGSTAKAASRGRRGPAPGTPRPPRMNREDREVQLLDIAEEIFTTKGYQYATMDDIAERAGITKPVIYDHFGSKEGLLIATIARAREQLRDRSVGVWRSLPVDADPEAGLRRAIRAFFAFIDDHGAAFALIQQEVVLGGSVARGIESIRNEQAEIAAKVLSRAPKLQGVPQWVLQGYAEVVIGTCERVAIWRVRQPEMTADDATDIVMTVIWNGLRSLVG